MPSLTTDESDTTNTTDILYIYTCRLHRYQPVTPNTHFPHVGCGGCVGYIGYTCHSVGFRSMQRSLRPLPHSPCISIQGNTQEDTLPSNNSRALSRQHLGGYLVYTKNVVNLDQSWSRPGHRRNASCWNSPHCREKHHGSPPEGMCFPACYRSGRKYRDRSGFMVMYKLPLYFRPEGCTSGFVVCVVAQGRSDSIPTDRKSRARTDSRAP